MPKESEATREKKRRTLQLAEQLGNVYTRYCMDMDSAEFRLLFYSTYYNDANEKRRKQNPTLPDIQPAVWFTDWHNTITQTTSIIQPRAFVSRSLNAINDRLNALSNAQTPRGSRRPAGQASTEHVEALKQALNTLRQSQPAQAPLPQVPPLTIGKFRQLVQENFHELNAKYSHSADKVNGVALELAFVCQALAISMPPARPR